MSDSVAYDKVVAYDAAPVMNRTARLTALILLSLLAVLGMTVAVTLLGAVAVALFLVGAALVIPEVVVERKRT